MYLMFGDEADADRGRDQKFFVYGAVFIDCADVEQLHDNLVFFGANTLLGKYDEFLKKHGDVGIAIMDRMPVKDPFKYLREKFQVGLDFPSKATRRLDNVVGFASTCDGASHLASMADILLGSFRYCVNEPEKDIANASIFPTLVRVMWCGETSEGKETIFEYGLTLRPEKPTVAAYKKDYDDLVKRLSGYMDAKEDGT